MCSSDLNREKARDEGNEQESNFTVKIGRKFPKHGPRITEVPSIGNSLRGRASATLVGRRPTEQPHLASTYLLYL